MSLFLILLAAGDSKRLKSTTPKPFQIVNNNNGERLETYVIPGSRGSGEITVNGAAARKVSIGDILILITYASMSFEEAKNFKPSIIFPNEENNLLK